MLNNFNPLKLRCSNHKCQIQEELLTCDFRHFTILFSMLFKNIISWAHYQLYWHVSILLRHFDFWDEYHRPFLRVDLNLIYCFSCYTIVDIWNMPSIFIWIKILPLLFTEILHVSPKAILPLSNSLSFANIFLNPHIWFY